jgi:hypothetical protein
MNEFDNNTIKWLFILNNIYPLSAPIIVGLI